MNRSEAITKLRGYADAVKARGATSLYLYGSTSRDEAGPRSDLDLFIDYDPASRFNALDLIELQMMLEAALHTPVDLTTRDGLHPALRDKIERSATQVF